MTPMMFVSGVFFPREQLPALIRSLSDWLPLSHAVELVRPLFMDQVAGEPGAAHRHGLLAYAVLGFWAALALTRRRFRR
ncbi:ABC transporter permease [Thauera sp. SDU_THAU2]